MTAGPIAVDWRWSGTTNVVVKGLNAVTIFVICTMFFSLAAAQQYDHVDLVTVPSLFAETSGVVLLSWDGGVSGAVSEVFVFVRVKCLSVVVLRKHISTTILLERYPIPPLHRA